MLIKITKEPFDCSGDASKLKIREICEAKKSEFCRCYIVTGGDGFRYYVLKDYF